MNNKNGNMMQWGNIIRNRLLEVFKGLRTYNFFVQEIEELVVVYLTKVKQRISAVGYIASEVDIWREANTP